MDDEPDVAELFRQRFRRETHQDTYVLHYATSGAEVLDRLAGEIEPTRVAVLSDINPLYGRTETAGSDQAAVS